jgi:hypothetical protein
VGGVGVALTGVAAEVVAALSLAGVGVGVGVGVKAGSGTPRANVVAAVGLVAAEPMARLAAKVAAITNKKNASEAIRIGCSLEPRGS